MILGLLLGDGSLTIHRSSPLPIPHRCALSLTSRALVSRLTTRVRQSMITSSSVHPRGERQDVAAASRRQLADDGVSSRVPRKRTGTGSFRGEASPSWRTFTGARTTMGSICSKRASCSTAGGSSVSGCPSSTFLGRNSFTKNVPPSLFLLPDEQIRHLLAGSSGDGYVGSADLSGSVRGLLHERFEAARSRRSSAASPARPHLPARRRTIHGKPAYTVVLTLMRSADATSASSVRRRPSSRALVARPLGTRHRPLHDLIPPSFCRSLPRHIEVWTGPNAQDSSNAMRCRARPS